MRSPVRATGLPHYASGSWTIEAAGPLEWLHGRRPVLSLAIRDFRLRFGTARLR